MIDTPETLRQILGWIEARQAALPDDLPGTKPGYLHDIMDPAQLARIPVADRISGKGNKADQLAMLYRDGPVTPEPVDAQGSERDMAERLAAVEAALNALLQAERTSARELPSSFDVQDAEGPGTQEAVASLADEQPLYERYRPILLPGSTGGFWAKITGNATSGTNRWVYSWEEVEKTTTGYGGWTTVSDGRSGTTTTDPAYNLVEDMNTGVNAHVEGNGVDPAHLDTDDYTFAMMPCTTGVYVKMHEVTFDASGPQTEYWFAYENGVDGVCD